MKTERKNHLDSFFTKRPWLKPNGEIQDDETIKKLCQTWSPTQWELFLRETIEKPQQECLSLNQKTLHSIAEKVTIAKLFSEVSECGEKLRAFIEKSLDALNYKQRRTLRSFYWEGKTLKQISNEQRISVRTIRRTKKAGIEAIKLIIEEMTSDRCFKVLEKELEL